METNTLTVQERRRMACDILSHSRGGDELSDRQIGLVRQASFRNLTPAGLAAFRELHARALKGVHIEWFHGVENLRKHADGTVTWRNIGIEHFSFMDGDAEAQYADILGERCRHLETLGVPVNARTAQSYWKWFADREPGDPWLDLLARILSPYEREGVAIIVLASDVGNYRFAEIRNGSVTYRHPNPRVRAGEIVLYHQLVDEEGFRLAFPCHPAPSGAEVIEFLEGYRVPRDLFEGDCEGARP